MFISWAATEALKVFIDWLDKTIHKVQLAKDALTDWNESLKEKKTTLDNHSELVKQASESYDELAKGVNTLNNTNLSLNDEDYAKFVNLNNQLAEAFPELKAGVDDNDNAIINMGNSAKSTAEYLQELLDKEERIANLEIKNKLPETFKNTKTVLDDEINNVEHFEKVIDGYSKVLEKINSISLDGTMFSFETDSSDVTSAELFDAVRQSFDRLISEQSNKELKAQLNNIRQSLYQGVDLGNNQTRFDIDFSSLENSEDIIAQFKNNLEEFAYGIQDSLDEAKNSLSNSELVQKQYWDTFVNDNLLSAMHGSFGYLSEDMGEQGREIADALIGNLNQGIIADMDETNPYEYIEKNIYPIIGKLKDAVDDSGKPLSFASLFDSTLPVSELKKLLDQIQKYCKDNNIKIPWQFINVDEQINNASSYNGNLIDSFGLDSEGFDYKKARTELQTLNEYTKDFNAEQMKAWKNATEGAKSAEEAIQRYEHELDVVYEKSKRDFSISGFAEANKEFENLTSLYAKFSENTSGGKLTTPIDISDVEALSEKWREINPEKFDELERLLTTTGSSAKDVQKTFDDLATEYAKAKYQVEGITEETKEQIASQMILDGVTKESAKNFVDYYAVVNKEIGNVLDKIDANELSIGLPKDALYDQKEYIDNLDDIYKQYGNINNVQRSVLTWTDENKDKYKNILAQWNIDTDEFSSFDWSTVLGDYMTKNVNGKEIEIAYSFLFDDGTQLVPLNPNEFDSYIDKIFSLATDETGKIDMSKVMDFDANGIWMSVNGTMQKIHGMLAGYEGQIVNGVQLTSDDIKAIAGETGDDIDSIYKGSSLHDIQADSLYATHNLQQLQDALNTDEKNADKLYKAYQELILKAKEYADGKIDSVSIDGYDIDTTDAINALMNEAEAFGLDTEAMSQYYFSKLALDDTSIDTSGSCQNLLALANRAGITGDIVKDLTKLIEVLNTISSGTLSPSMVQSYQVYADQLRDKIKEAASGMEVETPKLKVTNPSKQASKAGKEAGDAYVEAFEKELKELDELKDAGVISEKEYLDRLRALYQRYFKDKAQYAKEYAKYEHQYLQGMQSLYSSAISAATSVLNKQKNALEKDKDNAIKALEKERDTAVKGIQKQIDALNDEIDKIREASEARKRDIDLQKKQYELARMQNQRTKFIYKDGQMVYETDTEGVRDAKEAVKEAEEEIQIAKIQKQVDDLEDRLKEIEDYYDELIASTEEFYDAQIEGIQELIDMWQELADNMELAENIALLNSLGITTEDVLSGNISKFTQFKDEYIAIMAALKLEDENYIAALAETYGKSPEEIKKMGEAFKENGSIVSEEAEKIGSKADDIDTLKDSVSELGDSSSTASTGVKSVADSANDLKESTDGLDQSISNINTALDGISTNNSVEELKNQFNNLYNEINNVLGLLTGGDEGASLVGMLSSLGTYVQIQPVIDQFVALKDAVGQVSTAIGGGGGAEDSVDANSSQGVIGSVGQTSGGNSLTDALKNQVEDAKTLLPEETALFNGESDSLLTGVSDVITALDGGSVQKGGSQEEGGSGESNGEDDPNTLIGANKIQYDFAAEFIPSETNLFYILANAIAQCVAQLQNMLSLMEQLSTMELPGGFGGGGFSGTAYGEFTGTAYAKGNWSAKSKGLDGNALVGELGQELVVHNDGTFETVGDNGAEFKHIKPNDIVFNHKQTEYLLKNGHINTRGKAYAEGNLPQGFSLLSEDQLGRFNLFNNADIPTMSGINTAFERQTKDLTATIKAVTNSSTINNAPIVNITGDNHFDCAGLQPEQVSKAVNDAFMGMANRAYQNSMKR